MVSCSECSAVARIETPMKEVEDKEYPMPAEVNYCFHCGAELDD